MKQIFLAIALFGAFSASAETSKEVDNQAYVLCKNRKQVRTVRVHIKKDGICVTYYSKDGKEKAVGSGRNHESCMGFLANIKTNLEKSNWTCRDLGETKMTASID